MCIKDRLLYKTVNLNSRHRHSGTNNKPLFKFRSKDTFKFLHSVRVKSIEIPFSWYHISSRYNSVEITAGNVFTVTIPVGNYNPTDLVTEIVTQCNAGDTVATWTGTYSAVTMKITLDRGAGTFTMNTTVGDFGLFEIIGGADMHTSEASVGQVWTSPNVVQMVPRYITVHSNKLSFQNWLSEHPNKVSGSGSNAKNEVGKDNVIMKVPVDVSSNNVVIYSSELEEKYEVQITLLKELDFYLEDQNGADLDLNGLNWSITLEVWQLNPNFGGDEFLKEKFVKGIK